MNHNMTFFGESVLCIGAHPDDIELGCGALIADIVDQTNVVCVTLSDNQENPDLQHLVNEYQESMTILGVKPDNAILYDFTTRRFQAARQEILEVMISLKKRYHPEVVLVHTAQDIHQDHKTITEEALRAFRGTTLLGFDVLRSSYGFFPDFLVEVSEEAVKTKINALKAYKTYAGKYYFDENIIHATAIRHGALAERPFAEGFDILRIVGQFGDKEY
ncbi:MAG: PIG-L deacetylase family protein [Chloroflexota bacterium]|nr:PIG-L deacetylase family protein [Chloroflexota bacterium]